MQNVLDHLCAALSEYLGYDAQEIPLRCMNEFPGEIQTWQATWNSQPLCLRWFAPSSNRISTEIHTTQLASRQGLAPKLLWADSHLGVVITEWGQGRHLEYADYHDPHRLLHLIKHLQQLHQIECTPETPAVSTQDRIAHYLWPNGLRDSIPSFADDIFSKCQTLSVQLAENPFKQALIHNDAHANNIVVMQQSMQCIDWAEAGFGDVGNDLAEILIFFPRARHEEIATLYLEKQPSLSTMDILHRHWLMRLALFSAWGLNQARLRDPSIFQKPIVHHDEQEPDVLLNAILAGKMNMATAQDYYHFAKRMADEFILLS